MLLPSYGDIKIFTTTMFDSREDCVWGRLAVAAVRRVRCGAGGQRATDGRRSACAESGLERRRIIGTSRGGGGGGGGGDRAI